MQPVAIPLILLGYLLASVASTQFQPFSDSTDSLISNSNPQQQLQPQQQQQNQLSHFPFPKRASERYGFGLGRRAFTYTSGNSGVKRLPVYNFGLGKRSDGNGGDGGAYAGEKRRPYSFGLGKRADFETNDNDDSQENEQSVGYDSWRMNIPQSELVHSFNTGEASEKRARPYSFGLGKRLVRMEESSVERRGGPSRYDFGLGRR